MTIFYILEYCYVYEYFVFSYFSYDNISLIHIDNFHYILMILHSVIPIIFYKGVINIASVFSIFIYVLVYIPFIVSIYMAGLKGDETIIYGIILFIIMIAFFLTDKLYVGNVLKYKKLNLMPYKRFETLSFFLLFICIIIMMSSMKFVNIFTEAEAMYDLRAENSASMEQWIAYLLSWITHAFLPVILVYNYVIKNIYKVIICIACYILAFMIDMNKITLLIPFIMLFTLKIGYMQKNFIKYFYEGLICFMSTLSILSFCFCEYIFPLSQLVIYRTQTISGLQFQRYYNFFIEKNNPITYYTQISVLKNITGMYPYDLSIGEMVAGDGSNSNANFLLMDGMASLGFIGCIFVSVLFIIMKSYMNTICKGMNMVAVISIFLFAIMSMINTSLFTSLISFGLVPIYIILKYVKLENINNNHLL